METKLKKLCFVPVSHWKFLSQMAMNEDWKYKDTPSDYEFPILVNYINYTYKRLANLYNKDPKGNWLFISQDRICFNTGLLTKNYEWIYMLMVKNTHKQPWISKGFFKESDNEICQIDELPRKATYINNIDELIFDTEAKIVSNFEHILEDEENRKRIPEDIRNSPNLLSILNGEIIRVKKRVACNYKVAVPQFYDGKVQFLLPLSLSNNSQNTDLVLAVNKVTDKCYKGYTCLTMDMAYNNARQIAKPETEWLAR